MTTLTGIAVSPGIVWGPAALLVQASSALRYAITAAHAGREIDRLDIAREATRHQLERIHARVLDSAGPDLAYLFRAQVLMLDDQLLVPRAKAIVAAEHVNAEWAVQRAFDEFSAIFTEVEDGYLRERRGDVADVVGRLQRNLRHHGTRPAELRLELDQPSILVADDLPPSMAGQIDRQQLLGLVLDAGSRTDHTAILARSLRLPTVASVRTASSLARPGTMILLDGYAGVVVIDPDPAELERARVKSDRKLIALHVEPDLVRPAATKDGVAIRFDANVELPDDVEAALANGAEGVGLFRSEFMLGARPVDAVDEDAQYEAYRTLVERMAPHPVTIRTFDVDENRVTGQPAGGEWSRGPMGLRGIRLSLARPDLFGIQLRALVRAARHGTVRVLFPFVASLDELRAAKAALHDAARAVRGDSGLAVGAMIEVPSAAFTIDLLAREADFFSIGTNDLIQYCLAVDRTDGRVAAIFEPLHPAVLRVVRGVTRAAGRMGRPVAVCGEMASDPAALMALMGLGITNFSISPAQIPAARQIVTGVALPDVRKTMARALKLGTAREVSAELARAFPVITRAANGRSARIGSEGENGER